MGHVTAPPDFLVREAQAVLPVGHPAALAEAAAAAAHSVRPLFLGLLCRVKELSFQLEAGHRVKVHVNIRGLHSQSCNLSFFRSSPRPGNMAWNMSLVINAH